MGRASANRFGSIHAWRRSAEPRAKLQKAHLALQAFVTDTSQTAGIRKRRGTGFGLVGAMTGVDRLIENQGQQSGAGHTRGYSRSPHPGNQQSAREARTSWKRDGVLLCVILAEERAMRQPQVISSILLTLYYAPVAPKSGISVLLGAR